MVTTATGQIGPNAPRNKVSEISQVEELGVMPNGQTAQGYRVYFTTEKGVRGSVFVPKAGYSVANVQAAVLQHAYELDQVQALGG